EGDDAQLDLIAARLLVVGDGLAQRHILVLDEALREPHGRGGRRRPAIWDAAKGRAAARAKDPCSTERLVRSVTAASSLFRASGGHSSPPSIGRCGIRHLTTPVKEMTNG